MNQFFTDHVGRYNQYKCDDRIKQSQSGRERKVHLPHTKPVHLRLNDICHIIHCRVVKYEYLLKTGIQNITNFQNKHQNNRR